MKKDLILVLCVCVIVLSCSGCFKKKTAPVNHDDSTTTTEAKENNNGDYVPWVVSYDWSNVEDSDHTPLFDDKVSMPVNMEEFLSKFDSAQYWGTGSGSTYIKASELLTLTSSYYSKAVYLYEKKPEEQRTSSFSLEITPDNQDTESIADCLKNGKWKLGTYSSSFTIPQSQVQMSTNSEEWVADTLDLIVKEYGRPSYIEPFSGCTDCSNPKEIYKANYYSLYWDCGDDLFGVIIMNSYNESYKVKLFRFYSTDYVTSTNKAQHTLIDFNTFINTVK